MGRVEPFTVYLLFLVLHPPEEVPSTEQWFTKRFSRIISNEVHIPPYVDDEFCTIKDFEADNPGKAITIAYNWCIENKLININ